MMTNEKFMNLPAGEIFATGVLPNSPEGIFITDSHYGDSLGWVAVKGHADDWCVYSHWPEHSFEWIRKHGDKIHTEKYIKRCVPCDDKVFSKYRH